MRAIIIDDKDARALLDALKLEKMQEKHGFGSRLPENLSPEEFRKAVVEDVHSSFHFVVCRWLQEQGASTVR